MKVQSALKALRTVLMIAAVAGGAGTASAQNQGLDEAKLKSNLEGKVLTLHHFYTAWDQRFDEDGVAKEKYETGPWTIYANVAVKKVSISKDKLKIEGTRIWVLYKGEPRVQSLARSDQPVYLSIELDKGADQAKKFDDAIGKIFLVGKQSFEDDVPDFWKLAIRKAHEPPAPVNEKDAAKKNDAAASAKAIDIHKMPKRVRVSAGVTQALLIKNEAPKYPASARWTRISGSVRFQAVIGKDGDLADLEVVDPVGAGLDEAAYDAIRKWKYKPYLLNGEPVEVQTQITVNFQLGR